MTGFEGNGHRAAAGTALPVPRLPRWQPLRTGLVDLFLYDHEELRFRDGRLLLRGNNGTGKSKVLALTLPFLLDGDLSAHRVEPDGDPSKRMEWNLLLGGRYQERLGYTWLELGRVGEDGAPVYLTLGCGLKAVHGRGVAARWLFITSQRVGADLWLVSQGGTALGRDRLIEAVGARGQVFEQAEAYRRAVDEHLFHLGPERYDALVNLLIQLRQPQLSKRPNQERLSAALSGALTPVDQAVLSDVAESFHDLEQQRDELHGLQETRAHVDRFVRRYRHYASIAARRQAQDLRTAQSAYEATSRQLAGVREELGRAVGQEAAAAEALGQVERELPAARAAAEELRGRPEVRSLQDAEERATRARSDATRAAQLRDSAVAGLQRRERELERAAADAEASRAVLRAILEDARRSAAASGTARDHQALVAPLALPDGRDGQGAGEAALRLAAESAEGLVRRREEAVRHVAALARQAANAVEGLAAARRRLDELAADRDAAAERKAAAELAVSAAADALLDAWRGFAGAVAELRLPDPDSFLGDLAAWAETLAGESPAVALLAGAGGTARNALAEARARALAGLQDARAALADLVEERERLRRGEHERPPVPYTRAPAARDGRPGAPLWQVVDFRDGLPAADRAGLEAALEASGLLDAWVTPDGRLLDPGTHDVVVTAGTPLPEHLGLALEPAVDRDDPRAGAVADATVLALLAGIGLGAGRGSTWVTPSGRWRLGVAEGAWSKPAPRFVGRGAREAARRQRLAELAGETQRAEAAVAAATAVYDGVGRRQRALEAELARAPDDQALRDAHLRTGAAARDLDSRQAKAAAQELATAAAEEAARAAAGTCEQAAADLGLPADPDGLQEVRDRLGEYRAAAARLWPEASRQADRLRALAAAEREAERAREETPGWAAEAEQAEREATEAESRRDTLRASIGATVAELQRKLEAATARIAELDREERRLRKLELRLHGEVGKAQGREQELGGRLTADVERRARTAAAFQRFASTGLLAAALPDLELPSAAATWAPDPTVRLARRVEQALAGVDAGEQAWKRVQQEIATRFTELSESLSRFGHQAGANLADDRFLVTVVFQGQDRGPGELVELLAEEIDHRERVLGAKERELLEEHLVNEVASHLQELIGDAEAQVQRMNAELQERPTSTGMRLRFRWEARAEGPAGLPEARRRLLRQDTNAWSAEDRSAVSAFLHQQITAERTRNETGTWLEHLTAALDYRAWHRFVIERWQDGRWRSAAGPASGGERALTVTLPLFAAASAHYRSAHPSAPRLVLLDEAFAGVDDDSRAKSMGLLTTFDLDFVMTSEREWGCYATVPGLAIHQLTRHDGIDAVHITRWEWDGRARTRVEPATPSPRPPPAQVRPGGDGHQAPPPGVDGHRPPAPPGGGTLW